MRELLSRWQSWGLPVVVIGDASTVPAVIEMLWRRRDLGLNVVGHIRSDRSSVHATGEVPGRRSVSSAEYALIAMPDLRADELAGFIHRYAQGFRRVFVLWDMGGLSSLAVTSGSMHGSFGIEIRQTLFSRTASTVKRLMDISVAAALGITLLPLLAAIWTLIRTSSAGPAFYGQRRLGRNGEEFTIWKFRTMAVDADAALSKYLDQDQELRQEWLLLHKLKRDPRVTLIGRILRRTSLDELPQLWNILQGDMSLVGPRPIVRHEVERYGDQFDFYRQVRPGVTGLWQVSGRNNTSYEERVALDRLYVRNWSLSLDVYILAKTLQVIMTTDGAY